MGRANVTIERLERRTLFAAGDLDPSFGDGDGVVTINAPDANSEQIHFIGRQGDAEKLIVGGSVGEQLALWRLNADGSIDASFGTNGQVLLTVPEFFANGSEVLAIDPSSGRIAVANDSAVGPRVMMFQRDGQLDTSFDDDGVLEGVGADSWIEFQSTGKLVLVRSTNSGVTLARLNADGSTDASFGGGGDGTEAVSFSGARVGAVEMAPDDRIVLAASEFRIAVIHGPAPAPAQYDVYLARVTADGVLDASFGTGGIVPVAGAEDPDHLPIPLVGDIVADADGDVHLLWVLQGSGGALSTNHISSFSENGQPGGGFSGVLPMPADPVTGYDATQDFLGGDFGYDAEGRIVVTGALGQSSSSGRFAARFLPDGKLDVSYGERGTFELPEEYIEPGTLRGLVLPGDGRAIMALSVGNVPDHSILIQQLAGGAGDVAHMRVNGRGTLVVHTSSAADNVRVYVRSSDGRLVVRVRDDVAKTFVPMRVNKIALYLHGGDDTLTIGGGAVRGVYCDGGDGNDTLAGGGGDDILFGAAGKDRLFGFDGHDVLMGGGGNDYLLGGAGNDDLFGNRGADTLSGAGGNDRLFGNADADKIFGGAGADLAADSDEDDLDGVETMLDALTLP